ncbi:Putative YigZ family protein OS=Streptomyces violarus OX=67380 GN=FHS41_007996 PE=3 SV=1 [Streptomyces violarus]
MLRDADLRREHAGTSSPSSTRYFGGVKLGAWRGSSGRTAVRSARPWTPSAPRTRRRFRLATVTVDHQRAGKLENDLRTGGREVRDVRYAEAVTIDIALPDADVDAFRAWLADATAGTAGFEPGGEAYGDA